MDITLGSFFCDKIELNYYFLKVFRNIYLYIN